MTSNFKKLRELTADQIVRDEVNNPVLEKILDRVTIKEGKSFIFRSKHEDHTDHTERVHSDNGYSESSWHTDSHGHRDSHANMHTDIGKKKKSDEEYSCSTHNCSHPDSTSYHNLRD
jgi:hypothetical protein